MFDSSSDQGFLDMGWQLGKMLLGAHGICLGPEAGIEQATCAGDATPVKRRPELPVRSVVTPTGFAGEARDGPAPKELEFSPVAISAETGCMQLGSRVVLQVEQGVTWHQEYIV